MSRYRRGNDVIKFEFYAQKAAQGQPHDPVPNPTRIRVPRILIAFHHLLGPRRDRCHGLLLLDRLPARGGVIVQPS